MFGKLIATAGALLVAGGLGSGTGMIVKHHSAPIAVAIVQPAPPALDPIVLDPRRLTELAPMVCQPGTLNGEKPIEPPDGGTTPLPARKRK